MKFLRSKIQKTRRDKIKIKNDKIHHLVKVKQAFSEFCEEAKLKWFGHLKRIDPQKTARRPRKRCIDQIRNDLADRDLDLWQILEDDTYLKGDNWRVLIHRTRETGGGSR